MIGDIKVISGSAHPELARDICKHLGITTPELPHKRQATDRQKDYRSYYTDDLAALVGNTFKRDVEMLGYRFDPE